MLKQTMAKTPSFIMIMVLLASLVASLVPSGQALAFTSVFINEIHYDNTGTDAGEAIEVAGPAGTDLTGWSLVLYNGANGLQYDSDLLNSLIPDLGGGFGVVVMTYPVNGIQNGPPDGIALVDAGNNVVQFLSYEGSFVALDGPANGMLSTDIGVSEVGTGAVGNSLQLTGTGVNYEDFTWSGEAANTFGAFNTGQTFASQAADPLINEFVFNHVGTDTNEYVEVAGDGSADYSAYTLLQIEGDGTGAGLVDSVIAVGTTNAAGYWTTGFLSNVFENGTVTLLLVEGFTGSQGTDLDTNNDSLLDVTPWARIVDDVTVFDGTAGDGVYSSVVLASGFGGSPFTPGGASRIPDRTDTNAVADWMLNDFDLAGIPGFTGTPVVGEAYNTPGAMNALVIADLVINEIDYDQPGTDAAEFIEIRNNGSADASLDGWSLELVNGTGGGAAIYDTILFPPVSLASGDYFVVCANAATVANCDLDDNPDTNFIQNGAPDAVGLRYNGNMVDAVSYEGDSGAPYTEGSGVGLLDDGVSATEGISRCPDGSDTDVNNFDFALSTITPGAANLCVDNAPTVSSTYPADGAMDFPIGADLNVTFSEPVDVTGAWFSLSCSVSGDVAASVSGGPVSFTLDPAVDLAGGESCTLTIFAASVSDQDSNDPPDNMELNFSVGFTPFDVCMAPFTPIYDIQGEGLAAAITGAVTTQGVVVGDYEGPSPALRGFYIQDATGDGDASTSDGIFVFNGNNDSVNLGDVVRVSGTAGEFQDQTQISSVTSIAKCGSDSVAPVDVSMPFPSATYLEQYEGMLVRFPQTLYVTEHFQLGRFGQVLLSSGGRLQQPTNVVDPGQPAIDLQAQNDLNKIILDDDLNNQNPDPILFGRGGNPLSASNTLRGGDTATGIVGIMTYTWAGNSASGNAYRIRPINAMGGGVPDFQPDNPRPVSVPEVGGNVRVVGMNLLNFFNTFDGLPDTVDNCTNGVGGAATDCRGADTQAEFDRQWPKTVAAILQINPDVLGVNEIENDGYGPDSAIQFLVDKLNLATAPGTYAFIDVDANTGQVNALGTDAIKVGLLYKPGVVTPIGQTAALNSVAFVNGGDSDPRSRPSIAQAFEVNANGGRFIVDANHFKSKGSACDTPDAGDGQGNCNIVRVNAAIELMNWLASDPTGTGDTDVLLIGDLNSYAKEDPITVIKNADFTNLIEYFLGPDAYSYVFDGQWGYLDQALGSASLTSQVTGVADYHINADEPSVLDYNTDFKSAGQILSLYAPDRFRVSDHDSVMVGLDVCDDIPPTLDVNVSPDTLWSPDHKYVEVQATVTASDNFDPNPTITLLSVTSNEPDDGEDDGNTVNDIVIVDSFNFLLRAERSGLGTGRVYTITYQVTDACGNSTVASATVVVPLSQGD